MDTNVRPEVSHYTYRISWSAEDEARVPGPGRGPGGSARGRQEFVATCVEFPSLSWLATSQIEALQGFEALLRDVVADLEAADEEIPAPFSQRPYSGKFQVRLGEHLHRDLAVHAAEERMSLNQYVVKKLAAS